MKIRSLVVINDKGNWQIVGWPGATDAQMIEVASGRLDGPQTMTFFEVDAPQPDAPPTVLATINP